MVFLMDVAAFQTNLVGRTTSIFPAILLQEIRACLEEAQRHILMPKMEASKKMLVINKASILPSLGGRKQVRLKSLDTLQIYESGFDFHHLYLHFFSSTA